MTLNTKTFFFWGIKGYARGELDKRLSLFVYNHGRLQKCASMTLTPKEELEEVPQTTAIYARDIGRNKLVQQKRTSDDR